MKDRGHRVEITGLSLGKVLAALYNNTQTPSTPLCQLQDIGEMTVERGEEIINSFKRLRGEDDEELSFDYVLGRPIKVFFIDDEENNKVWLERADLYDRDSHRTAAEIVQELMEKTGGIQT